ncbi:hypothetical protein BJ970_001334 [Saccharopolyspora phatthalungensis]|uniref:PPE family domain-containing protein n=1 Tax=Saccharopolyspora phatthalungensis TaxID=664693 RepID=A0A840Q1G4_9PSEU|nr:hypothetical protein [Saccharopolyspora phatthalungensis]
MLTRESDRGNTDEIMQQVGFNHPEKYKQIHEGKGPTELTNAVSAWKTNIGGQFDEVHSILDGANKKANLAWTGQAAEEHGTSLQPMAQFIDDAKTVSASVGDSAGQQVDNYFTVKNSMPPPVKVDATDNLLEKGGAWLIGGETDLQKQEREATEKAQEAKRYYDNYSESTSNVSQNLAFYPKAPEMAYAPGSENSTGTNPTVGSMPTGSGIPGGGSSHGGSSTHGGGSTGTGDYSGGSSSSTPAQSGSQWSAPPAGTSSTGLPGGGPGTGVPAGTGPGTGAPTGGFAGFAGGLGAGAGAGGLGAGGRGLGAGGAGRGAGMGAGGRAGLGGPGSGASGAGGAAGAGGRGGAGGMGAGAGGRGQGKQGEEDQEHENKYMVDTDEAWDDLGLPRVAPPVFGE